MQDESIVEAAVMSIGALLFGSFASSLLQPGEQPPPPTDGNGGNGNGSNMDVVITGIDWEEISFPYPWYGQDQEETATFYKGKVYIQSDRSFTGRIALSCGSTIAPVPLLTSVEYQALLSELNQLIAESTGSMKEIWQTRKEIALQFPEVDGFYIDFRWYSLDNWWDTFTRRWMLGDIASVYLWEDIDITVGENLVDVGFFTRHTVAIATPVTVSLLEGEQTLTSVISDAVSPGSVPQILAVDVPATVTAGNEFDVDLDLYLPELLPGNQYYGLKLSMGAGEIHISEVANFVSKEVTNATSWQKLTSPDSRYQTTITLKTVNRQGRVLPEGTYPIKASIEAWKVSNSPGSGIYIYGYFPLAEYEYGEIGQIEVT